MIDHNRSKNLSCNVRPGIVDFNPLRAISKSETERESDVPVAGSCASLFEMSCGITRDEMKDSIGMMASPVTMESV